VEDPATTPKRSLWLPATLVGLATVTIAVLVYSAISLNDVADLAKAGRPESTVPPAPKFEEPIFDEGWEPAPEPPPANGDRPRPPTGDEMMYALPVAGDPLVVVLPGKNASLGNISIEKYDSEGNATGKPLAQGTRVQIPDPNNPGGKIYFRVP